MKIILPVSMSRFNTQALLSHPQLSPSLTNDEYFYKSPNHTEDWLSFMPRSPGLVSEPRPLCLVFALSKPGGCVRTCSFSQSSGLPLTSHCLSCNVMPEVFPSRSLALASLSFCLSLSLSVSLSPLSLSLCLSHLSLSLSSPPFVSLSVFLRLSYLFSFSSLCLFLSFSLYFIDQPIYQNFCVRK